MELLWISRVHTVPPKRLLLSHQHTALAPHPQGIRFAPGREPNVVCAVERGARIISEQLESEGTWETNSLTLSHISLTAGRRLLIGEVC